MIDWKDCPDCWGTGLIGGFSRRCEKAAPGRFFVSTAEQSAAIYIRDYDGAAAVYDLASGATDVGSNPPDGGQSAGSCTWVICSGLWGDFLRSNGAWSRDVRYAHRFTTRSDAETYADANIRLDEWNAVRVTT